MGERESAGGRRLTAPPRTLRLDADGLSLRALSDGDVDELWDAVVESAAELRTTMPWWRADMTRQDQQEWVDWTRQAWADGVLYAFAIRESAHGGRYLGSCSLEGLNWKRLSANISYWVRTSATGGGVATQAVRALARWAVKDLGLQRVEISMITANEASAAVARKSGAVFEGVLRNWARFADRNHDMRMFSFVPADYPGTEHHQGS